MNLLFSTIGRRGYLVDYFRAHLSDNDIVVGTGNERWTPGFAACDVVEILPDIEDAAYRDAVKETCARLQVDALFSLSDADVHKLAPIRDDLEKAGTIAFLPSADQATIAFDKVMMEETLTASGFAVPETTTDLSVAANWDLPVFVKPRYGSGSRNAFVATSVTQLEAFFSLEADMLVQRLVDGTQVNLDLCGDLEGGLVAMALWRRHRSRLGETELAETFHDQRLSALGERLAASLQFRGPVDVDLVVAGDDIYVLDINPRFGGGYPVAHLAGVDFPKLFLRMLGGEEVRPKLTWDPDVVMMKELHVLGGPRRNFAAELGVSSEESD